MRTSQFFVLLLAASTVTSICRSKACLSLSPNGSACCVCNHFLGFRNNGVGACFYSYIEHCLEIDSNGYCLRCDQGYVPVGATC